MQLLATKLGVTTENIVDFELNLFDVQPASLGGVRSEFIHSARLDNLASCFLSLKGLLEHVEEGGVEIDDDISMIAMFDHEEVRRIELGGISYFLRMLFLIFFCCRLEARVRQVQVVQSLQML